MSNLLETARRYLDIGLAPIPCHAPSTETKCTCRLGDKCVSPGKHPAVPWQRFQKKKIDSDQLVMWFDEYGMFSKHNIGIVTGEISGNVFVVDVDLGAGKLGQESLEELQLRFDDFPLTLEAKTGSGGRHYFFRAPQGVRIITDKNVLGPGVDVRGEGGFVVAAPSKHVSGGVYECDFDEIADAPPWLIDLVQEGAHHEGHGRGIQEASGDNPFRASDGREGVMVRVILAFICNYYQENEKLPELDELLEEAFPIYVNKVKARSDSLEADGRGISLFEQRAKYQLYRAKRNDLRVLETLKNEVNREKSISRDVSQLREIEIDRPSTQDIQIDTSVDRLVIKDWSIRRYVGEPPAIEWLIAGVIPQGIPCLLAAIGGIGKSFLSLDLALKVAGGGEEWDDQMQIAFGGKVASFGRVVFLTAEDSAGAIHRRLDGLQQPALRAKAKENLFVVPLPDAGGAFPFIAEDSQGLHHTGGYIELRNQLLELAPIKLIIFDPLQAFVHADVTSDPAAAQFWWSTMAELASSTGATILVSHHMRKEGSFSIKRPADARQAIRGTTALVDGARLVYGIWGLPEAEEADICKALALEPGQNNVACGAVVKTNEFADMSIRTFRRAETGLLVDCTAELEDVVSEMNHLTFEQEQTVFSEVSRRWIAGAPFNPNPRARTSSFVYWLGESMGIQRRIAEKKMLEWINKQQLAAELNEKTKQPGLNVGQRSIRKFNQDSV